MKFKCEVEIDYVNEDYTLDESVKSKLAKMIAAELATKCSGIKEKAQEVLEKEIKEFVKNTMVEFMSGVITITDRYGDVKREGITVKDLIKENFDRSLNMKVDKNGNPSTYSSCFTLLEWFTGKAVQKEIADEFKGFSQNIKKAVEAQMQKKIKEEVAENFATLLVNLKGVKQIT
jgi:hypothetical protein